MKINLILIKSQNDKIKLNYNKQQIYKKMIKQVVNKSLGTLKLLDWKKRINKFYLNKKVIKIIQQRCHTNRKKKKTPVYQQNSNQIKKKKLKNYII